MECYLRSLDLLIHTFEIREHPSFDELQNFQGKIPKHRDDCDPGRIGHVVASFLYMFMPLAVAWVISAFLNSKIWICYRAGFDECGVVRPCAKDEEFALHRLESDAKSEAQSFGLLQLTGKCRFMSNPSSLTIWSKSPENRSLGESKHQNKPFQSYIFNMALSSNHIGQTQILTTGTAELEPQIPITFCMTSILYFPIGLV